MKKIVCVALVLVAAMTVVAVPAQAWNHGHFHSRVFIGVGPAWWGPPYWYYPPAYAYAPPVVVQESPPVYIQQQTPAPPPPPPPPAAQATPESFWYYCSSAKGYYPTVPQCAEAWVKVPAR